MRSANPLVSLVRSRGDTSPELLKPYRELMADLKRFEDLNDSEGEPALQIVRRGVQFWRSDWNGWVKGVRQDTTTIRWGIINGCWPSINQADDTWALPTNNYAEVRKSGWPFVDTEVGLVSGNMPVDDTDRRHSGLSSTLGRLAFSEPSIENIGDIEDVEPVVMQEQRRTMRTMILIGDHAIREAGFEEQSLAFANVVSVAVGSLSRISVVRLPGLPG